MARSSLSNSHRNLNLSESKTIWMQKTIKVGNSMAQALRRQTLDHDEQVTLANDWEGLMIELVEMML